VSEASRKVLDVPGGSLNDSVPIQQFSDNGGTNQHWELRPVGNGNVYIRSEASKKVLDVPGSNGNDGVIIQQYQNRGGINQQWQVIQVADAPRTYKIISVSSGKLLDVPGGSPNDSVQIQQFHDNGGANQRWELIPVGNVSGNTIYKIMSEASQKVLDVPGGSLNDSVPIQQFSDNGGTNQHWELLMEPSGNYYIRSEASKKVLDVPGSNGNDGVIHTAVSKPWRH
jgi:hypothetical protein